MDEITRLGSMTTRWRLTVRWRDRTPPFDSHEPVEFRALSEATALDLAAHYLPELEVLGIDRAPSPPSARPSSSASSSSR